MILALILLLLSAVLLASAQNDTSCGPCVFGSLDVKGVVAAGDAIVWDEAAYTYLNETVYINLDATDNTTITTSAVTNTDARASSESICNSAAANPTKWQNFVGGQSCIEGTTTTVGDKSLQLVFPTNCVFLDSLVFYKPLKTEVSGREECFTSAITIPKYPRTCFPVRTDDTTWISTFINAGKWVTYLSEVPIEIYATYDGHDLRDCAPVPMDGIPNTKIAVRGIASTVYNFLTPTSTGMPQGSPPPASPSRGPGSPSPPGRPGPNMPSPTPTSVAVIIGGTTIPLDTGNQGGTRTGSPGSPQDPGDDKPAESPVAPLLPSGFSLLPSATGVVLPNGETLTMGETTLISGTPVAFGVASGAPALVFGGTPTTIAFDAPTRLPLGLSLLPGGNGVLLPDGGTLLPSMATTIDGTVVSLPVSGAEVIVGGKTVEFSSLEATITGLVIGEESTTTEATASNTGTVLQGDSRARNLGHDTYLWVLSFFAAIFFV